MASSHPFGFRLRIHRWRRAVRPVKPKRAREEHDSHYLQQVRALQTLPGTWSSISERDQRIREILMGI